MLISAQEIERATEASRDFKQAIVAARYHIHGDKIELVTPWCVLVVDRKRIPELRDISIHDMETIIVSTTGLHIDAVDVDINSAGLLTDLARQIETEAALSY